MKRLLREEGFTLIEILVVVALVAVLAAVTIIAINPAKNFSAARDTERVAEINEILNAVTQYTSEQGNAIADLGTVPDCSGTPATIGSGAGNLNLATTLVDEWIVAIPTDPSGGTDANTGYRICQTTNGRIQIDAPNTEVGADKVVKR